ncbi:MAG TPA: outer membrane beta-barrel protein [Candidatus Limnocylindrales bacterium]|nr:outer membrane beta-barrel protein [Candidatus Limnocylindrales bacterium]
MKCRYAIGVAALSLCLGAVVAQAQYYSYLPEGAGPTFRVGVGPSFFQDSQITQFSTPGVAPTGPVPSKVDFDTGLAFDAAFGWAFNRYAALDFETGFIGAEINNVPGYLTDNSRIYSVPFLVNATLSYPIPRTNIIPYVGAGVGGADMVFDTDNFQDSAGINGVVGSENDVVFAGQVFAGVRFALTRHLMLDLGYKYFATGNPTFTYPPDHFDVGFKGARTHSVLFGLTFDF